MAYKDDNYRPARSNRSRSPSRRRSPPHDRGRSTHNYRERSPARSLDRARSDSKATSGGMGGNNSGAKRYNRGRKRQNKDSQPAPTLPDLPSHGLPPGTTYTITTAPHLPAQIPPQITQKQPEVAKIITPEESAAPKLVQTRPDSPQNNVGQWRNVAVGMGIGAVGTAGALHVAGALTFTATAATATAASAWGWLI